MGDGADEAVTQDAPEKVDTTLSEEMQQLQTVVEELLPNGSFSDYLGELTVTVQPDEIHSALETLRDDEETQFVLLLDVSAVHWPGGKTVAADQETTGWPVYETDNGDGRIEVDYLMRSIELGLVIRLRVNLPDEPDLVLPSATDLFLSADFMEREVYDLMGVTFAGHPNMTRILLPDDWEGHPHRKDYPLGGVEVMYMGQTVPPPDERDY